MNDPWANRLGETADVDPQNLIPHPENARIHGSRQRRTLDAALDEVGWIQRVIVNSRSGRILDGHLRVLMALERGDPTVPVSYVDVSDAEERTILLTLDPIAALAETSQSGLSALLAQQEAQRPALQAFFQELQQDFGLLTAAPASMQDLEQQYGEGDPQEFWPTIRFKVEPETMTRYTDLLAQMPGTEPHAQFAALLACVTLPVEHAA